MENTILLNLKKIVDIDTSKIRNIKRSFNVLNEICINENLNYVQFNNKVALISSQEINLQKPYCGIIAHIDVVGINKNSWEKSAFDLDISSTYLTGRGVIDNKGSLISCLHSLKNLDLKTNYPWVLIVGSCEEVSMLDIKELFEKVPEPQISFTPDGLFDICLSEPHIITCDYYLENTGQDIFKSESKYYNVVCGNVKHNHEDYIGKATHISDIEESLNALYLIPNIKTKNLTNLLKLIKNNKVPTINSKYFSSFNIGFVTSDVDVIKLGIDIRIDGKLNIDKEFKILKSNLESKFGGSLEVAKVYLPGYSHENNELFKKYSENKKIYEAKGGTYARMLNNCFVIGPQNLPDSINGPHSDNERIKKSYFLNLVNRYEKVILELDQILSDFKE